LIFGDQEVCLHLRDNGAGFNPAVQYEGFGLQGIRERAETMGCKLTILSEKGVGTTVSIILPADSSTKYNEPSN
jgi:signal transduction histidine kinase